MEEIIRLAYGETAKKFSISGLKLLGILKPHSYTELKNQQEAIHKAIRNPDYGPPVGDIAQGKKSAVILVSDKTRRTLAREIVPPLLDELSRGGVPSSGITVIIAVGAHPMLTEEEIEHILGSDVVGRVTVVNHDSKDFSSLEYRGVSSRGTPIYINRAFLEAELKIITGSVDYHDFAGLSGGAKSIVPGVSGFSTISHNHLMVLNPSFGEGYNHLATAGVMKGNPVHEDMEEIAELTGPDFIVNVVFNAEGRLSQIASGSDWKRACGAGCKTIERIFSVKARERADVVLVSAGRYPFDINFYQAMKSITNTMDIVKDNGVIVLVASCTEGLELEQFREWLNIESPVNLERVEKKLYYDRKDNIRYEGGTKREKSLDNNRSF